MTYSRPGTSRVNALVQAPRPNPTRIIDQQRTQFNPSGRFIDTTNVQLAGQNARVSQQTNLEIANLLGSALELAPKVIKPMVMSQAQSELGELLQSSPDLGRLYRESDPAAQAQIQSLNPLTRDLFIRGQYETAKGNYTQELANAFLSDPGLTYEARVNDPEGYTRRLTELKTQAMQSSGLTALPKGVLGVNSGELGQIEGAVNAQLSKAQYQQQADFNAQQLGQGLVSQIENASEGRIAIRESGTVEDLEVVTSNLQQNFRRDVEIKAQGVATPKQHLSSFLRASETRIESMLLMGDYTEAANYLEMVEVLAAGEIKVGPNGQINYWDQRVPTGKNTSISVPKWIRQQDALIEKVKAKGGLDEAIARIAPLAVRAYQGDPTARMELEAWLPTLESNPQALAGVVQYFGGFESAGDVWRTADLRFLEAAAAGNLTPEQKQDLVSQVFDEARNGQRSIPSALRLADAINRGKQPGDATQSVLNAQTRAEQSGNVDQLAADLSAAEAQVAGVQGLELPSDLAEQNKNYLQREAFNLTRDQVEEAQAQGKPLTQTQIQEAYETNIQNVYNRQREQLSEQGAFPRTANMSQVVTSELNEISENIRQGKTGIEIFPQRILDLARQRGIDTSGSAGFRRLSDLMVNTMRAAQDAQGKPEFPNPGQALQQTVRAAEQARKSNGPGAGTSAGGTGNQGGSEPVPFFRNDTTPPGIDPDSGLPLDGKRQPMEPQAAVLDGLSRIAGVLLPGGGSPAAASEMPKVLNEDQTELLARMWSGQDRPTLQVPQMPQVDPNAPTQAVPTAITSDRHPFFVAIGIAEGTRTANGGYTQAYYGHRDPGDGNYNRGTVSGGRGNRLTPEQVDQRWMSRLSSTSIRATGALRAMGLQPGTQGFNRVMFNILDLTVQAPAAVQDFIGKLGQVQQQGLSIEAIAKARADSFYNARGQLDAPGFGNSYQRLFTDQRSRAGVWDYRRRF